MLAVLAGCGAVPHSPSVISQAAVPACVGHQLVAAFGSVLSVPDGAEIGVLTFADRSRHTCAVEGKPEITLLGSGGQPLAYQARTAPLPATMASWIVLEAGVAPAPSGRPVPGTAVVNIALGPRSPLRAAVAVPPLPPR